MGSNDADDENCYRRPAITASLHVTTVVSVTTLEESNEKQSLLDVIKIIPEDCYRNPTAKGMVYVVRSFAMYFVVLAGIVAFDAWWALVPLILLAGIMVSGLFVIGHDASHGALFSSSKLNLFIARLAMLPSAHIEAAWDLGHNRIHHGHTVKQGMDFVWHPITVEQFNEMSLLRRLRHRLEWSSIGPGFYYGREVWWNKMMRFKGTDKWGKKISADRWRMLLALAVICTVIGGLGWMKYGSAVGIAWTLTKVAIIPWLLFITIIGFTVYVHHVGEDIRWYQRREWSKFKGQMEGTTILRIPKTLNFFWHNIFVHVPHHVDMRIPFYKLPAAADAIKAAFPGVVIDRKFSFLAYLRTTRACKLYNFELGKWSKLPA
jgi:omega-6 fatty acid desaturase (delta-12 desaturase)